MKQEYVKALNYSAHAIEDIRELAGQLRYMMPQSAQVLEGLADMLGRSVKFLLPNCCELIDPAELTQKHLDLTRLPYPVVAFEAPWEKEMDVLQIGGFEQYPATKRIALCWEIGTQPELLPGLHSIQDAIPGSGVFIVSIYWGAQTGRWSIPFGGMYLPYENTVQPLSLDDALPASRYANAAMIDAGKTDAKGRQFRAEPFRMLPEIFEGAVKTCGSVDKAVGQIMLDTHDEVMTVVQACSVINCSNVSTYEIPPEAKLNKKRERNGKQPFFTYKVLQLTDELKEIGKRGFGGSHASPRMHLRRGHLRRLEHKAIWIRPTVVKAGSRDGAVIKDYAVDTVPED